MKILIAEDQPPAALYLRRTLEKMGHETTVAPDGEQAWNMIRSGRSFALDLRLDDAALDGPELCRRIRAVEGGRYIYIILLDFSRPPGRQADRPPRRRRRLSDQTP